MYTYRKCGIKIPLPLPLSYSYKGRTLEVNFFVLTLCCVQVEELIKKHKEELLKKRYRFNVGMIMGEYIKLIFIFSSTFCYRYPKMKIVLSPMIGINDIDIFAFLVINLTAVL